MTLSEEELRELIGELGKEYELKKKKPKSDAPSRVLLVLLLFIAILNTMGLAALLFILREVLCLVR